MMFCVFVYMCFCVVLCKICSRVGKRGTALCSDVLSVHCAHIQKIGPGIFRDDGC